MSEKVLAETQRLFEEAALDQPELLDHQLRENRWKWFSRSSVVEWWGGGVLWVCFSGAIFGFHLVRRRSHVHTVLRSASFNPGEFKPESTGRDVKKDFEEGFVKAFGVKSENPFRFLEACPAVWALLRGGMNTVQSSWTRLCFRLGHCTGFFYVTL